MQQWYPAPEAAIVAQVRGSASSGRVVDVAQPADPRGSLSAQEVTNALADAELECKHINLIISSASSSSVGSLCMSMRLVLLGKQHTPSCHMGC